MRFQEFTSLMKKRGQVPGPSGRLGRCRNIQELRLEARRFLPSVVFDYVDGGAEDELTLRRNSAAFKELDLLPRALRDVGEVDLRTEILGCASELPFALAPTGATGLVRSGGEVDVAAAAGGLGIPCTLSTMSSRPVEDVAAAATGPLWFQLYVFRDHGRARELIGRARAAGCRALMVTVDTAVGGRRERDVRHGYTLPPTIGAKTILDGLRRPRWSYQFLRGPVPTLGHVGDDAVRPPASSPGAIGRMDPTLNWSDLEWITEAWGGPVVVKGIMTAADAKEAAAIGVRGVVVSNHGGRQLEGAPATIEALGEVVDAVGDRVEVLLDSGIRRGGDIVRALAIGARGCLIGRPFLYGYAAGGRAGIEYAVGLLGAEVRRTMALMGVRSVGELDRSFVRPRGARQFWA